MNQVLRSELMSNEAYERIRPRAQARIIALKKHRRILLGPHMSLVFENRQTARFQIQEVLRAEGLVAERGIARALEESNLLIPEAGEVAATLFLEFVDREVGSRFYARVRDLARAVVLRLGDQAVPARLLRLAGDHDAAAVNYLRFPLDARARRLLVRGDMEVRVAFTHPAYRCNARLPDALCRTLAAEAAGVERSEDAGIWATRLARANVRGHASQRATVSPASSIGPASIQ